ncbi:MAG: sigma-54-dependent Fis family transcriptional regulator [Deltaproteobacteria bacterium]|nr:MAG: sigma-54-dependent Fis family transcriptional regulator [Deltaproteobacteria bacterium]
METILIVDDEKNYLLVLEALLTDVGYEVITTDSAKDALGLTETHDLDLVITDMRMPGLDGMEFLARLRSRQPELPVIMMTAYATVEKAVEAMKRGAFDYITKPFKNEELKLTIRKAIEMHRLMQQNRLLSQELQERFRFDNIVGKSKVMRQVYEVIEKVAQTRASVLITGESGTGKELIARSIHFNSQRRDKPFISVNCSALSETLLESELFGHERGAFTGAIMQRKGRFELAHGGSLFLDEVGDMSPSLQVKLLRVLQEMAFERVGGSKTLKVDARLITASNRDLRREVETGRFREDLYYRLKVVHIKVPPLRQRRDDIPLLVHHFLEKVAKANSISVKDVSQEALRYMYQYDWVGNVRELENVVERAVILCDGNEIDLRDLPEELLQKRDPKVGEKNGSGSDDISEVVGNGELLPYLGLNQRQMKAINFIKKNGFITNRYYTQINSVMQTQAKLELRQLVDQGLIKRVGGGRSVRYVLPD